MGRRPQAINRLVSRGYPRNWPEIARAEKERASWKCERCGMAQGAIREDGKKVVLTTAHLGETKQNKSDCSQLIVLCKQCHGKEDAGDISQSTAAWWQRKWRCQTQEILDSCLAELEAMPPEEQNDANEEYRKLKKYIGWARGGLKATELRDPPDMWDLMPGWAS